MENLNNTNKTSENAEKEMEETEDRSRYLFLDGKITAYKMVIIDLLE